MHDFHTNKEVYFDYQYRNSKNYIVPFVQPWLEERRTLHVLEIGCGEAGVLKAFTELGHACLGIELSQSRVDIARQFMAEELENGKIDFITRNIYDIDVEADIGHRFDLVILKDVIEHIPNQEKFIRQLHNFLKPDGIVFFGFPPWYMPFGGHQQMATKKILSMPYYHILPKSIYRGILKLFGERENRIKDLMEIKDTAISIERFERIVINSNFKILNRQLYLFNPIYRYKFNLKPRRQATLIAAIPFLRNFLSTCAYYVIRPTNEQMAG